MKKLVMLLILLATMLITAGCIGDRQNSPDNQIPKEKVVVEEVTQLAQINESLKTGPVLVKIGAEWCDACRELEPILEELAAEYNGKATIVSVDIDKSMDLANYFEIGYIPDSSVIVGIENGEYVYMQENGNISKNRVQARILGLQKKDVFENTLNHAILENNK